MIRKTRQAGAPKHRQMQVGVKIAFFSCMCHASRGVNPELFSLSPAPVHSLELNDPHWVLRCPKCREEPILLASLQLQVLAYVNAGNLGKRLVLAIVSSVRKENYDLSIWLELRRLPPNSPILK